MATIKKVSKRKLNKEKNEMLNIILNKKIAFFDHCFAFTTFSRSTAYAHGLDKMDAIRDAISQNRVQAKNYMLQNWITSKTNSTLQIAAFRLLADSEEHKKLNQSYVDHTTKGDKMETKKIQLEVISKDELVDDTET